MLLIAIEVLEGLNWCYGQEKNIYEYIHESLLYISLVGISKQLFLDNINLDNKNLFNFQTDKYPCFKVRNCGLVI